MLKNEISLGSRKSILEFQKALIKKSDEIDIVTHQNSTHFPLKHTFADGIYVREMLMEKDSVVVGAIHKHLHVWFLLTGNISVATEDSSVDYNAPCYVLPTPGTKRVIKANQKSTFINIHKNPTDSQNVEWLEKEIVAKDFKEYEEYINKTK